VVLAGSGKGFCAGADVGFMTACLQSRDYENALGLVQRGSDMVRMLREMPKPVLCSLNGPAAGGGANLALACDLRIASDRASLGQVFHRIGLHPDMGGTYFLPRLVGPSRALELIWSTEMIPADRCLALGLVNRVVPHDRLAEATAEWAARLAALPPLAAGMVKAAVYQTDRSSLAEMLTIETRNQLACFRSQDAEEGLAAFAEKRTPTFHGH
jgi:2-(1,2-epoxy-1,2-dihydrophenyl)acetyl-CoA isomerase